MKLYVWDDPYPVDYGSSVVFAVAATLDAAREQAQREIASQTSRKLGDPDEVYDVPVAVSREWRE